MSLFLYVGIYFLRVFKYKILLLAPWYIRYRFRKMLFKLVFNNPNNKIKMWKRYLETILRYRKKNWHFSFPFKRLPTLVSTSKKSFYIVWAGTFGDCIVGHFLLLGNFFDQILTVIMENNEHYLEDHLIFQPYEVSPHHSLSVRQYFGHSFINWCSGRKCRIEWPARSPYLFPPDFLL